MDRIKQAIAGETIDTVSTSPAYDDLFDPMMSKAAPQPPETHEKDTDVSGVEKEPRHENDASGSRDANRKPEPARGFSSREKARQQKQAAWQAQNKL